MKQHSHRKRGHHPGGPRVPWVYVESAVFGKSHFRHRSVHRQLGNMRIPVAVVQPIKTHQVQDPAWLFVSCYIAVGFAGSLWHSPSELIDSKGFLHRGFPMGTLPILHIYIYIYTYIIYVWYFTFYYITLFIKYEFVQLGVHRSFGGTHMTVARRYRIMNPEK